MMIFHKLGFSKFGKNGGFSKFEKIDDFSKFGPDSPECFFQKYDIFSIKNVKINEILLFYVVNSVFYAKLMVLDIPVNVFL